MFSNNMWKTVWEAMQQSDLKVSVHVNKPGNENNLAFPSGLRAALNADMIYSDDVKLVSVSGFYKHGEVFLYENPLNDEIHVYGRYGRLSVLPNHPDFDYAFALAEINANQFYIYCERGFPNLDTGWGIILRKHNLLMGEQ